VFTGKKKLKETKEKPPCKSKRRALAVEQSHRKENRLPPHYLWLD